MEYLLILGSLVLILLVVMTGDKHENSVNALARSVLRLMAMVLFAVSFAVAFGIVEIPTKYYGYVKLQHQLTYATVIGLGAVTVAILSVFTVKK